MMNPSDLAESFGGLTQDMGTVIARCVMLAMRWLRGLTDSVLAVSQISEGESVG